MSRSHSDVFILCVLDPMHLGYRGYGALDQPAAMLFPIGYSKVIGSRACDKGRETRYSCEIMYRGSMAGYRYVDAKRIALGVAAVKTTGKL